MRGVTPILCAVLTVCAVSCLPDFAPASRLDDTPQVLAVRAEPPAVAPGATLRLDALVHWPDSPAAPGAAPEHLWLVCRPTPADSLESCVANRLGGGGVMLLPCDVAPAEPLCYASRDATALYTVPADLPLDAEGQATLYVELVVGDDVAGDDCVRAYRDLAPSERCLVALKRLSVSALQTHVNPSPDSLQVDGLWVDRHTVVSVDPTGAPGDDLAVSLSMRIEPTSADELRYADLMEETLLPVAWYSDCGTLSADEGAIRCANINISAPNPACDAAETVWEPQTSGECTVHVTVRDGRGGVGWWTQRFLVGG